MPVVAINDVKFHNKTNYSKIFKECYWGAFKLRFDNEERNEIIFKNRNDFVEEFKIKKHIKHTKYPYYHKINHYYLTLGNFDHTEIYSTHNKDEMILINSPYGPKIEITHPEEWLFMHKIGWRPYKCIYHDANTYILKLSKNHLRTLKVKRDNVYDCTCDMCKEQLKINENKRKKISKEQILRIINENDFNKLNYEHNYNLVCDLFENVSLFDDFTSKQAGLIMKTLIRADKKYYTGGNRKNCRHNEIVDNEFQKQIALAGNIFN